jgi:Zn-dependent protease
VDVLELQEIVVSVFAIAFAFTVYQAGGLAALSDSGFWVLFMITLVTVGLGFVLHELAHRHVARRYGAYAIYRAWPVGLLLMVGLAVIGSPVLFAAPGAVMIYASHISREENGIISIAGPLTNIALALVFAFGAVAVGSGTGLGELAGVAFMVGFQVNVFLALFNLIPFYPLDGSKVFDWNKGVWGATAGFCFILMVYGPQFISSLVS